MKKIMFFLAIVFATASFAQTTTTPQLQQNVPGPVVTPQQTEIKKAPKTRVIYRDRPVYIPYAVPTYVPQQLVYVPEPNRYHHYHDDTPWGAIAFLILGGFTLLYFLIHGLPAHSSKETPQSPAKEVPQQHFHMYGGKGGEGGHSEANIESKNKYRDEEVTVFNPPGQVFLIGKSKPEENKEKAADAK